MSIAAEAGMDGMAPTDVTEIAAAAVALRIAHAIDIFSERLAANTPLKTSPAAVVSTGLTE
jgi:hypothetical protein